MGEVRFCRLEEVTVPDVVYASFRSHRKDRCAVMAEFEAARALQSSLDSEFLLPDTNYQWSGIQRLAKNRAPKRVFVGDYTGWFCWFMRWQRLRAFHTIVLVEPVRFSVTDTFSGYLDGLLARLLAKPIRIVVVESPEYESAARAWVEGNTAAGDQLGKLREPAHLSQMLLGMLYGTRLQEAQLRKLAEKTLYATGGGSVDKFVQVARPLLEKSYRTRYIRLNSEAEVLVESLAEIVDHLKTEPEAEKLFERMPRRLRPAFPDSWLRSQILAVLKEKGWATVPILAKALYERHLKMRQDEDRSFIGAVEEFPYLTREQHEQLISPSRATVRRVLASLHGEDLIDSGVWHQEVGRPVTVYRLKTQTPFWDAAHSCGQCAFYVSLHRQCRLWSLLGRSFGLRHPRWEKDGEHPLSWFDLYKMRNAWRISPRSPACTSFVEKNRDYSLKAMPDDCDICSEPLSPSPAALVVCANCRTRYFRTRRKTLRVLTAHEDRFRKVYLEIAGHGPAEDVTRLLEERAEVGFGSIEQSDFNHHRQEEASGGNPRMTLMLLPGDKMLTKDGKLFLLGRRKVESVPLDGTIVVDHGVLGDEQHADLERLGVTVMSVAKPPQAGENAEVRYDLAQMISAASASKLARELAMAMARSAIHATGRLETIGRLSPSITRPLLDEQSRVLRRLESAPARNLLAYEALIMKRYWALYQMALKVQSQRFGPRKRSRFVREHVTSPTGRAKGYTAVDAAINYLHQRRLFKIGQTNSKLGISVHGEGFLHNKRWNARGLGLLLDLADPLKFADREMLLEAVLAYQVNWRDFYTATDRQGTVFYYPKSEIIPTLERISDQADNVPVQHAGSATPLMEAYQRSVLSLAESLKSGHSSFVPFEY